MLTPSSTLRVVLGYLQTAQYVLYIHSKGLQVNTTWTTTDWIGTADYTRLLVGCIQPIEGMSQTWNEKLAAHQSHQLIVAFHCNK